MFKELGPNEAASSEGYSIKRSGRFELQYTEDERRVTVEVEPGDGLAIYTSSISHWKMNDGSEVEMTGKEVKQVVARISEGLSFLNTEHVIE